MNIYDIWVAVWLFPNLGAVYSIIFVLYFEFYKLIILFCCIPFLIASYLIAFLFLFYDQVSFL